MGQSLGIDGSLFLEGEGIRTCHVTCQRWISRRPQLGDQPQDLCEQHPWHGDLDIWASIWEISD
jgi:hypothetical protein